MQTVRYKRIAVDKDAEGGNGAAPGIMTYDPAPPPSHAEIVKDLSQPGIMKNQSRRQEGMGQYTPREDWQVNHGFKRRRAIAAIAQTLMGLDFAIKAHICQRLMITRALCAIFDQVTNQVKRSAELLEPPQGRCNLLLQADPRRQRILSLQTR